MVCGLWSVKESTQVEGPKTLISHIDWWFETEVFGVTRAGLADLAVTAHVRHPDFGVIDDQNRLISFASDQAPEVIRFCRHISTSSGLHPRQ